MPGRSKKFHYFRGGRSLCGGWGFFGELDADNNAIEEKCDPETCKQCWSKRQRELASTAKV
jgi:hypothetical protein